MNSSQVNVKVEDLVSIITPHYNNLTVLRDALDSVQNQTYSNYEHIIVDDDSLLEVKAELQKLIGNYPNIKLIFLDENRGAGHARNIGITAAQGRFIAFLDCDDMWEPAKLQIQIEYMIKNSVDLCYSEYHVMNSDGVVLNIRKIKSPLTYPGLLKTNSIGCLTAVYDTTRFGKVFMPTMRKRQDLGLWLKLAKLGAKIEGIHIPLARYRLAEHSLSSNKASAALFQWKLYRENEQLGIMKSLYYFGHYVFFALLKRV
ncbi:glycosyltransferase family 2 protein [Vibrio algivorus]|uniref:glycosyltransferase family 2 protein n=1 Tax=Vibrio algivorus TaxID=1667024 RepID=UPI001642DBB5|nr:glycosyltransferase family 2 protein [Vibrio algivorus]